MANRYQYESNRVLDQNGIADGATIDFFESGTTTPITIYSDASAAVPIANPVVVPAGGAVPEVYWTFSGQVRVRITSTGGIQDIDPYSGSDAFSQSAGYPLNTVAGSLQQRAICITDAPFSAPTDGTTSCVTALEAIAALSDEDLLIFIPAGDWVIDDEVLFTDKNVQIFGAGKGLTRLRFTSATASLRFLSTSTSSGFNVNKQPHLRDFTCVIDYTTTALTGAPLIDVQASFAGIISSWHHGSIQNVLFQGQGATKFFNKCVRLTDIGNFHFDNCNFDNGGAQLENATCFIEIRRLAASNITTITVNDCYGFGALYGILITHATASAGTIEGVAVTGYTEFVGVGYTIYDDNQGMGDQTRQINLLSYEGFSSYSRAFAKLGYVANLELHPVYSIASTLAAASPALEGAVIITESAQIASISGRWLRSPEATIQPSIILPTRDQTRRIRIHDASFEGWSAVVNQTGVATGDRSRILIDTTQHDGVPLSTTMSGFEERSWQPIHNSAVPVADTGSTNEFTAFQRSITGGTMGPNGRLRITIQFSHTNSANLKALRVKLGGTTVWSRAESASNTGQYRVEIANRGNEALQIVNQASSGGWGASTGSLVTTAINTAASQNLDVTMQLTDGSETVTMESIIVEAWYGE